VAQGGKQEIGGQFVGSLIGGGSGSICKRRFSEAAEAV
jgi:hypothetical protein